MRSKRSFFNGTVIKKDILHFTPAWILWLIVLLAFLGSNLSGVLTISEQYGYEAEMIPFEKTRWLIWTLQGIYTPQLFAIFGCLFGLLMFYYLHFSKSANMIHAYPVRRETLFCSHFLSGLLMTTVPAAIGGLVLVFFAGGIDSRMTGPAFYWMLWAVVASFLFYSMTVVLCMLTGVIFVVPVLFLIANYLVDGIRFLILSFLVLVNYGLDNAARGIRGDYIWSPIEHLSTKVGFSVTVIDTAQESRIGWESGIRYTGALSLLIYVLVSVVLVLLALFLYRKRRIEDVGKIITARPLRPVFQWGVTFCGALLLMLAITMDLPILKPRTTFPVALLLFLGFSVLIYYLLEVIMTRRWRSMTKRKWVELACFAGIFSVLGALCEADAFGVERRLPDMDRVIAVEAYTGRTVISADRADMERILALQEELIEEKELMEDAMNQELMNGAWVSMTYYDENGEMMSRSYGIPLTEETIHAPSITMLNDLMEDERLFLRQQFCVNYEDMRFQGGDIDLYDSSFAEGNIEPYYLEFGSEEAEELYDAYLEDFRAGNLDTEYYSYDTEETGEPFYNDLELVFYIPGGYPVDQYMLLDQLTESEEDYELMYGMTDDYWNSNSST